MPETHDIAGVVRLRLHTGIIPSSIWLDGKNIKAYGGMSFEVLDAATGENLLLTTRIQLTAEPGGMALVELTELAGADGEPFRRGVPDTATGPHFTFTEAYDPETGDVRTVTRTYLLAGIEEVD